MNFNTLERTWVIAEIGVNHEGDEQVAHDLVVKAAEAGADAVKFQTFEIEHYISTEQPERFERTKGFQLSREAFVRLSETAKQNGVVFFSTPFGLADVAFLDSICPVIKISSGDLTFLSLIQRAAETGKPLIISTGLGTEDEIQDAVDTVTAVRPDALHDGSLALMHCVATYPTAAEDANLRNISWLQDRFGLPVGYSDHTLGIKACELAIAAGAQLIEKHFTYRKEDQTFHDHHISADPDDLAGLVGAIRTAETYLGRHERKRTDAEELNADNMRRAVGLMRDMSNGDVIEPADVTWLRPAWGLPPQSMDDIIGKTLNKDLVAGSLLRKEDIE